MQKTIKRKHNKKGKEKTTYDEEFTDYASQYFKSAAKDDFGLNDQLQIVEEALKELNDFPKEGDDETVIDVFGTTFNFASSL